MSIRYHVLGKTLSFVFDVCVDFVRKFEGSGAFWMFVNEEGSRALR